MGLRYQHQQDHDGVNHDAEDQALFSNFAFKSRYFSCHDRKAFLCMTQKNNPYSAVFNIALMPN